MSVKNDLKGITPSRSFENIKFYRWLKIGVAQKHYDLFPLAPCKSILNAFVYEI